MLSLSALIISIIVGLATIATIVWRGGGLAREVNTLIKRHEICPISQVQQDIIALKSKNETFWAVIQPHLATIIHSPEHAERDALVDKLISGEISRQEAMQLELLLEVNIRENHDEGKRLASALLLARTKIVAKCLRGD